MDDGGASASAPPLGTRKGADFALKGTAAAPTAVYFSFEIEIDIEKNVSEVEVEAPQSHSTLRRSSTRSHRAN